jgi:hypothetical protein
LATDYDEYCGDLCYRRGCDLKYKCNIYDGDDDDWKRAYTIQKSYTVQANGHSVANKDDDDDDDWDWKDQDKVNSQCCSMPPLPRSTMEHA